MADENPYAATVEDRAAIDPAIDSSKRIWRQGRSLVLERGAQLPTRCVKCNCSHELIIKRRRFTCTSFNLALSAKATTVLVGICQACNQRRKSAFAWAVMLTILGWVLLSFGVVYSIQPIWLAGVPMLLVGLGMWYRSQVVVASRIDRKKIHLVGICREFLAELPSRR